MNHLPGLDASFLHLETAQMPMHVGALHNLELPAAYAGDFVADLRRHMAERLALMPALRRKLVKMPLNLSNPVWVDDEPDLDEHIVRITLPPGSEQAELERQVGLLHPVLLDRSRPLWKFHVFEGLRDGPDGTRRVALYSQLHHAAVDGQAAVALAQAILDVTAAGRAPLPPRKAATSAPLGIVALLRGALGNQLGLVVSAVKAIPGTVGVLSDLASHKAGDASSGLSAALARLIGQGGAGGAKSPANIALAPRTRLNTTVSTRRAFASVSLPLARVNAVRRLHGASLNDAVLMVCSGALRRLFLQHGPLPRKSMIAGVPISTRAQGDTASNNQATMTTVSLGTHIADPAKRLAHVLAATAAMKANIGALKSLMPTDFPSLGLPWLMEGLGALYAKARVADRLPTVANLTISNVPGPPVRLYIAGARMLTNYPTSIVVHGVALNITVQTYADSLEFGIIACGEALPEVSELAAHVTAAFEEFAALPAQPGARTAAGRPAAVPQPAAAAPRKRVDAQRKPAPAPKPPVPGKATSKRGPAPARGAVGAKKAAGSSRPAKPAVPVRKRPATPAGARVAGVTKATSRSRASAPSKPRGGR